MADDKEVHLTPKPNHLMKNFWEFLKYIGKRIYKYKKMIEHPVQ